MRAGILLISVFVGACTTVTTVSPPPSTPLAPLQIEMAVTPEIAFDRVVAAFVAEGLTVDQADRSAGLVKSMGIPGEAVVASGMAVATASMTHYYRATVMPRSGGAAVALTVTGKATISSGSGSQVTDEAPLSDCPSGDSEAHRRCRESLARTRAPLDRIAARLRS